MKTDSESKPEPDTDLPSGEDSRGTGSPVAVAIAGYMEGRNQLVAQIPAVNLYYDSGKARQQWMKQEIERIDSAVAELLALAIDES